MKLEEKELTTKVEENLQQILYPKRYKMFNEHDSNDKG